MQIIQNGSTDDMEFIFGSNCIDSQKRNVHFLMFILLHFFQALLSMFSLVSLFLVPKFAQLFFCSVDEQVGIDIQLIDAIAEKQALIFSEECKLFPADVQIQSIYPL